MKQQVIGLVMVLGMLVGLQVPVLAEDSVSLQDMLVEKGVLTKEDEAKLQETILAKWVNRLDFSGDLRIRDEEFFDNCNNTSNNCANGGLNNGVNRNRTRFRLRLGAVIKISDFTVGFRLASGTGEQVSTNQTFQNLFSEKSLWIDRAYLSWQGSNSKWLKITAGKMPNPYVIIYSSDVVWDDDINPEGFAENLKFSPTEQLAIFLNAGQFVLNEVSSNDHDPWLLGEQAGFSISPQEHLKLTLATAFYYFVNASGRDSNALGGPAVQQGNSREQAGPTPPVGTLLNNYRVFDATAEVNANAGDLPIAVMGDYVRNVANTTVTGLSTGPATGNYGYQLGAIVGKASNAHTWEVAYFYKVLQTDATVADMADSDFGNGGTARRGHIMWAAYNLTKYLQFKTKYFITTSMNPPNSKNDGDINRLQVDVAVKF
jgi:Putative porin